MYRFVSLVATFALLTVVAMSASTVSARRLGTSSSAPYVVGPVSDISGSLSGTNAGKNAEVEQAVDPKGRYVYEAWIAFSGKRNTVPGIAFARSDDGGKHFATPISVYDSQAGAAWDPAITVAPNGTVYVSYMVGLSTATRIRWSRRRSTMGGRSRRSRL